MAEMSGLDHNEIRTMLAALQLALPEAVHADVERKVLALLDEVARYRELADAAEAAEEQLAATGSVWSDTRLRLQTSLERLRR